MIWLPWWLADVRLCGKSCWLIHCLGGGGRGWVLFSLLEGKVGVRRGDVGCLKAAQPFSWTNAPFCLL